MTDKQINIAKLLYAAYPHADLLPIDPAKDCCDLDTLLTKVTGEDIGDSLFRFMVVEMVEGGQSSLSGAIRVIDRAREDVQAVLEALYAAQNPQTQHLYEVCATEYNGCQEYAQSKLLTAADIVDAIKAARAYFQNWYDDGENSKEHRTNDPDVFVFNGGAIRVVIRSIQKITLGQWVRAQLELHGIDPVLDEIKEIKQAKAAIAHCESKDAGAESQQIELMLKELSPEHPMATIPVRLLCEHGKLWIRPSGYGDACSEDGQGFPIALELWQGRLRLVAFTNINDEEPQILDLENARQTNRNDD